MERETKTIETPATKTKLVINMYILGREKREIQNIYLNADDNKDKGEVLSKVKDAGLKAVIVSVNGHKEGDEVDGKPFSVLDFVLNMRSSETNWIFNRINEITKDEDFEDEKKTS